MQLHFGVNSKLTALAEREAFDIIEKRKQMCPDEPRVRLGGSMIELATHRHNDDTWSLAMDNIQICQERPTKDHPSDSY